MTNFTEKDTQAVNAIRALAIDMIQHAGSGHPGLPLDASPMLYVLYKNYLRINPKSPDWFGRDRFVLSAGHGSSMMYALLHLLGYGISMDDLKDFRQLGSQTPGHPELGTPGIDAATGPLGQGFGMSVGMAMAAKHLATKYNADDNDLLDNQIFTLVSDGDLMEGVSHESASLAGHLKLNNLVALYDSNDVTLDAQADKSLTDDVEKRFTGYGWNYLRVEDGNDLDEIDNAIKAAVTLQSGPTIIEVKTTLGYGSPKAGQTVVHGNPLGDDGVKATKEFFKWQYGPFEIPTDVYATYQAIADSKVPAQKAWMAKLNKLEEADSALFQDFEDNVSGQAGLPDFNPTDLSSEPEATRATMHNLLQTTADCELNFWGGSADLSSSNKTYFENDDGFEPDHYNNKNIFFGVREFASAAAVNGITLFGGSCAFTSTFFVFSDYMKNAIRMAGLQKLPSIFLFSHDSVALGPDGPTHQPVEQLDGIRAIPNVILFRPADALETQAAWAYTLRQHDNPVVFAMSRQPLKQISDPSGSAYDHVAHGGYVISPAGKATPDGILIAAGSEVELALAAQTQLLKQGHDVAVVSVPSQDLFNKQSAAYKESVLPSNVRNRVSIEMGSTQSWGKYVGIDGVSIGIDDFGESGNANKLMAQRGFTTENVVKQYLDAFGK